MRFGVEATVMTDTSTSCPYEPCGLYDVSGRAGGDPLESGYHGGVSDFGAGLHNNGGVGLEATANVPLDTPGTGLGVSSLHGEVQDSMHANESLLSPNLLGTSSYNSLYNSSLYNTSLYSVSAYNISGNVSSDFVMGETLVLSAEAKVGLILLYSLTTLLAISGNVLVVLVFTKGRRCRTDIRPFLVNLAVADLIMALFCMPFTFSFVMLKTWVFSKPMCTVVLFMQHLSVSASVFTNMAIGSDRFLVVMFPLRSRVTTVRAKYVILVIWVCAVALSSVQLVVGRAAESEDGMGGVTVTCDEAWQSQGARRTFTLFVLFITYIIPLTILAVAYSIVGILLWTRTTPGNAHEGRDLQQLQAKRKVVKMLVLVVTMFGVCWLPLHTFFLVIDFNPELTAYSSMEEERFFTALYYCVHWLAMSNSFVNPIIYSFSNDSFRVDLVCLLYMGFPFCKCLKKIADRKLSMSTAETHVRNRLSTVRRLNTRETMRATHPPHKQNMLRNGNRVYFELKRGASGKAERARLCDMKHNGLDRTERARLYGYGQPDRAERARLYNHDESDETEKAKLVVREDSDGIDQARLFQREALEGSDKARLCNENGDDLCNTECAKLLQVRHDDSTGRASVGKKCDSTDDESGVTEVTGLSEIKFHDANGSDRSRLCESTNLDRCVDGTGV